jgi:PKD repeat protein
VPDNLPADAPFTLTVTATAREASNGSTADRAAPIEVTVRNVAPTAVLDAPASGVEGSPVVVSLTGASDASPVDASAGFEYAFDFGAGYGAFTPAATASFSPADNGTLAVRAKVRDKDGGETEYTASVEVANADPVVSLAGPPSGIRGQSLAFAGVFTDPGSADTHEVAWDFGDGTVLPFQPSTTPGALSVSHVFTVSGVYTVRLTVRDDDGAVVTAQHTVEITAAALQPDSQQPGKTALVVGGTSGDDLILIHPTSDNRLEVVVNNVSLGAFAPTGRLIVYAQAGNDNVQVAGSVAHAAWLYGDGGDDRLNGGAGANVLLGGAGDDQLSGGGGRELMIGGAGADRIVGNSGDDVLIGGATAHDANEAALWALMQEWTSAADYDIRLGRLRGTLPGGLNGSVVLDSGTVLDDLAADLLTGTSGLDWFLVFALDDISSVRDGEELN